MTDWTNTIVDNCLKELQSLNKPYKYIITSIIMQKNGAGVNTCASMVWDPSKDNYCQVNRLRRVATDASGRKVHTQINGNYAHRKCNQLKKGHTGWRDYRKDRVRFVLQELRSTDLTCHDFRTSSKNISFVASCSNPGATRLLSSWDNVCFAVLPKAIDA